MKAQEAANDSRRLRRSLDTAAAAAAARGVESQAERPLAGGERKGLLASVNMAVASAGAGGTDTATTC